MSSSGIANQTAQGIKISVTPTSTTVPVSGKTKFSASVANTANTAVTWQVNGITGGESTHGTIDVTGLYTAPAAVPSPAAVTIAAISQAQPTKMATAQAIISTAPAAIAVAVSPLAATVQVGHTQTLTAILQNDTQNKGVTWTLTGGGCGGPACGTLSATSSASGAAVTYAAPSSVPAPATVTATATSVGDSSKTAAASFTIASVATPAAIAVTVNPPKASVQTGKTQSIAATVQNDSQNRGATWTLRGAGCSGAACGSLSATSSASGAAITYIAPATAPNPSTVTVTATSVADTTKMAASTITITSVTPQAIAVSVNPPTASVQTGKTQSITAKVQNDSENRGVTWALSGAGCDGAACGSLSATSSASGVAITYTAPASAPNPVTVTVTATSVTDKSKKAATTITVTSSAAPTIVIGVNPPATSVQTGQTHSITANVQNDSQNKGVTWTLSGAGCNGAACGSLSATSSASGVAVTYTAPANAPNPATVTVTATSVADNSKTAATAITITSAAAPAITVTVNPAATSVQTGQTQSITANVRNDSQIKGVTWTLSGAGCSGAACGSLSATSSASGAAIIYTAPAAAPSPATVTVTASSVADSTKTGSVNITITSAAGGTASVSVSPTRAALTTGQSQTFTATVSGNSVTAATWEVDSIPGGNSSVGTISVSGLYSPPSLAGMHTVVARSGADPSATASASVAVTDFSGVFTYHNDLSRDGVNSHEYALNTTTVSGATFGKRFSCGIDAAAYAQPLWVANVNIGGGTHNIVVAATQHDTVYAFDADAAPCQTYWSQSLLANGEKWVSSDDVSATDITPDIGIVGTPVIDASTNTIYVVSKSKKGSNSHQRLHALSLTDGSERFNGPQEINFTAGGITFNPLTQNQRAGLALVNGVVYIAYASHGDNPTYYGWIVGYSASSLNQVSVFNDDPSGGYGGIWMSGGAPAADSNGNLYVITGNGNFDGNTQFGDSFLKLSTGGGMGVLSYFAPSNQASLSSADQDLGSGGTAVLIDQPSGPTPHLLVGGGKEGRLFLLNRDNLGGNNGNDSGAVQSFVAGNAIFATPAFWQNTLYLGLAFDHVKAYSLSTSSDTFNTAPASQSPSSFGYGGATPSISAQGSSNGVVWAIENAGTAVLHAYDASNLGTELWNSANNGADQAGPAVKFTVPTVANGKVYVGTASQITVYGLSPN